MSGLSTPRASGPLRGPGHQTPLSTLGAPGPLRGPAPQTPFRSVLTFVFRRISGIYFREIEILGGAPSKHIRGRLFVSNHVNAIIDPILILTTAQCDISPVAKTTLWKVPGFRWLLNAVEAVPIARRVDDPSKQGGSNDKAFEHVGNWLNGGGNILIFPEGTSHNEPHLTPLKTGAARMLLRAVTAEPSEKKRPIGSAANADAADGQSPELTFQSVALEFDDREKFRSRVLLIYGPVRNVADFAERGDTFIENVTEQIRADLSELLVEGATWDERRLITRVAEMLANEAGERTLGSFNEIGRKVGASRKTLSGEADTYQTIKKAVDSYYNQLLALGLTDEDIRHKKKLKMASLSSGLLLLLSAPLAAVGTVIYGPPYWTIFLVASRVKSQDETSTIKLGLGLVLYPLWLIALIALTILFVPNPWAWPTIAMSLVAPAAAIFWLDKTPGMRRALRVFLPQKGLTAATLGRENAMALIKETQQKLGL